ncbi:MAG: methyltransferase domain-containing protein [Gammaproteobacteria bacterium]|nr:methyltransferase domain-containing protein [Gammaproteobacteria bacterium]
MLAAELTGLASVLPTIFGYYIVQIGGPTTNNVILGSSKINNKIVLNPIKEPIDGLIPIRCDLEELPFMRETIDAVVLFHTLEFAENPKLILKEIYDSLINGGYLIILGPNPKSLWGITKIFKRSKENIWGGHWFSPVKLRHWLHDIGFSVGDYQTFYFRPAIKNTKKMIFLEVLGQIFWPYCGASYMIMSQKKSTVMTPIKELRSAIKRPRFVKGFAKPISRVILKSMVETIVKLFKIIQCNRN